jgi:hypothetical protein
VLDETAEFENAVSVSSYEELVAAQSEGNAVRVDADIRFAEEYSFSTPVYVSKGVTVSAEDGVWLNFDTELFINCGNMDVGFSLSDNSFLLNCGTMTAQSEMGVSLWASEGALIFNMGTIEGNSAARVWTGAYLYNIGTLNAYNFYLTGGICFNYGSIYAKTGGSSFTVTNVGRLYNFGSFEAEEDSEVCNNGWVDNAGSFLIGKSAVFDNTIFYNRNYFECSITSTLNRQSGIYYGSGEFCINGLASVAVWRTADWAFETDGCEVTSEEELREALKNNEVSQILVSSPIEIAEDIEITKPLLLCAALTVDDAAVCSLKNTYMVVSGGTLAAKSLTLSNALLVANKGTVDLTGAVLEMDNRSSFAADDAAVKLSESSISAAQRSVLSMPFAKDSVVADSTIVLEDSWLFFNRNVQLKNTEISLQKESSLRVCAENFFCNDCRITLEKDAVMAAEYGNISFLNKTAVTNSGKISVDGWNENRMVFEDASLTNYGEMDVYIPSTADEDSTFDNEGTLEIRWAEE